MWKYARRHGLLPPKYMRKVVWRLMIRVMPREVVRFIQSRFGELKISEARYEDLLSEADQLRYIMGEAGEKSEWPRYLGVMMLLRGPYEVSVQSVVELIEALMGLRRKVLSVDNLLDDFGPRSRIASRAIKAFYSRS